MGVPTGSLPAFSQGIERTASTSGGAASRGYVPGMSARVDLVALHAEEYAAGRAARVVPTTPARYLSLDGAGQVQGTGFLELALALSGLLRDLRARVRRETGNDFRLPPLEALLGAPRTSGIVVDPGGVVPWKLLLRIPAFVRSSDLAALAGERPGNGHGLPVARIEELREGRCIQALHLGPLAGVPGTVDRLRRAAADQDLAIRGRLHQVWLSDLERTPAEKRRTILRLPVKAR
jgi:hypothetical protein